MIVQKLGNYLFEQDVIGYVTVELVAFADGKKSLFWAIDLKLGFTDIMSQLYFAEGLNKSLDSNHSEMMESNSILDKKYFYFTIPTIISNKISYLRMKELVNVFRSEHLIYDMDKKIGVVFNIPDVIQSGIIGLLGVSDGQKEVLQLIEESAEALNSVLTTKNSKESKNEFVFDEIDAQDLISRLKLFLRHKLKMLSSFN